MVGRGSTITATRVGINSGSGLSTLTTVLTNTSGLLLLASRGNLCATSPHDGPRTRLVGSICNVSSTLHTVTNSDISNLKANNVDAGLRTTSITYHTNVSAVVTTNDGPNIVNSIVRNVSINALFRTRTAPLRGHGH